MVGFKKIPEKQRRQFRRKNHIAKDLRSPKYAPRVVEPRKVEDELERRIRRYGYGIDEE